MPLLILTCPICFCTFTKKHTYYNREVRKQGHEYQPKCSTKCAQLSQIGASFQKQVQCLHCGGMFSKTAAQIRKTSNHFCSRSCAASHNNRNKEYGTRRSKLEQYLEEQIGIYFPELPLLCNSKDLIGSELDFYFPTLKLAIELNGIFHYEPIYGREKLNQIQDGDRQKSMRCRDLEVEFCAIDASTYSHLTVIQKRKYWNIVFQLLSSRVNRHSLAY